MESSNINLESNAQNNNNNSEDTCSNHDEIFKYHCEDCSKLICESCFVSHYGHKMLLLKHFSEKQRIKLRSMNESLISKSKELNESILQGRNKVKIIQDEIVKNEIELKDLQYRIASIEKLSLYANDCELTDQMKFQNLLDYVRYKYLLKITGFSFLPTDIWQFIFSKIGFIPLLRTSTVCIEWKNIIPKSVVALNTGEINYYWDEMRRSPPNLKFNIDWRNFCNIREIEFHGYASALANIYNNDFFRFFPNLQILSVSSENEFFSDEAIMGLTNLRYLYLEDIELTDKSIKTLTNLETLNITEAGFGITVDGIRGLTNLTSLFSQRSIQMNHALQLPQNLRSLSLNIEVLPVNFLRKLTNLTVLSLDIPQFEPGTANEIGGLTNLIDLRVIRFDSIKNENLRYLTNLTYLNFRSGFQEVSFEGIKPLTKLKRLGIHNLDVHSNFGIEDIRKLTYLTNLSGLNIICKQELDFSIEDLRGLTNLTKLNISRFNEGVDGLNDLPRLSSLGLIHLKKCTDDNIKIFTNLTKLRLFHLDVTDEGIKDLTSLTSLSIGMPNISNKGIKKLTNITKLNYLADEGEITRDGINKLKKLTYFSTSKVELDDYQIPAIILNTSLMRYRTSNFSSKLNGYTFRLIDS